jgi:hypothetical protein
MLAFVLQSAASKAHSEVVVTETAEKQFRAVRTMHRMMLAAVILYVLTAEGLAKPFGDLPVPVVLGMGVMATVVTITAFGFRMKKLAQATESLRRNPLDTQALIRWRQAHILIMVLLVSVALFGFALRFMGGSFRISLPFYTASVLLLLLWAPREVVDKIEGSSSGPIEK